MPFSKFQRVLITGTTSGLGKDFQEQYLAQGVSVCAINRRRCEETISDPKLFSEIILDITDPSQVRDCLNDLKLENKLPDLFILNAGVNRPDNFDGLDFSSFADVMNTNLMGVMTFVGALHSLEIRGKTIVAMSSTSNIVPNPAHIGYYVSKLALDQSFALLNAKDHANSYKSVILGPVHTEIMAGYPKPSGLQGRIFETLATSSLETAKHCMHFFEGKKERFYYPKKAITFYFMVRLLLKFFPRLYRGTAPSLTLLSEPSAI